MQQTRRLAAILFTDIVGSTAIMQKDEQTAVSLNKRYVDVLQQSVLYHGGEIINDYGDGSLCIFSSATAAMRCAIEMQQQFQKEPKVPLRIGLHIGEIFFENEKVFGDGVNVASRVQSLGIANSILFSSQINIQIKNQNDFKSVSIGMFHLKNVDEEVEVFALANEGLVIPGKKEMSGKLEEIKKKSVGKKWIIAALMVLLIAGSYFIYQKKIRDAGFSGDEKTIAVLPFENIDVPESEEYISDGVTQDIIGSLSKISSLKKVIGWFSVRGFKKTIKPLDEIAGELGVAAILSGTIQQQGVKTRVIAELIEVNTKKRLWGDDFEYDSKDILTVQSKIAGQIVNALKATITPEEKRELAKQYTENPEAYKLYRKGLYLWNKSSQPDADSAEIYYKRAIDIDPEYAIAYAGLANCYIFNRNISSQMVGIPVARTYATKALSLDSNLSEALTTLGWIQGIFDYDWAKSKITLEKALKLKPNYADAHLFYGNLLQYTGENTEQGIAEIKKALESDPLNLRFNWVLGRNYYFAKQDELALQQLKKTIVLNPNLPLAKGTLALLYLKKKMYPQAIELINQMPKIPTANYDGQDPFLCYAYAVSGDSNRAKSVLDNTLKKYPDQSPYILSYAYIALKNYYEALSMIEAAYKVRDIRLYWVKVDPVLDPIRNEPRFKILIDKMHLD
jgi:adenylate cyclase